MKKHLLFSALSFLTVSVLWFFNLLAHRYINEYYLEIIVFVGINIILAVSLNLINGFTGQFSIGHAGFMALGGYTAAFLTVNYGNKYAQGLASSLFFVAALFLGASVATIAGIIVGLPTLRLRGDYLAIATLGFGEIVRVTLYNVDAVGGARGFPGIPAYTNFFWVYLFTLLTVIIIKNLASSAHGRALLAIREDEIAAEASGINTTKYKVTAFALGAAFAGLAGGLYAHQVTILHPDSFGFMKSVEIIVMVVLGGMGSITGSVMAAVILTVLLEALRTFGGLIPSLVLILLGILAIYFPKERKLIPRYLAISLGSICLLVFLLWHFYEFFSLKAGELRMVVYSALLIILMLSRPQGILGAKELNWKSLQRLFGRKQPASIG